MRTCGCGREFEPTANANTRCGHPECDAPTRSYRRRSNDPRVPPPVKRRRTTTEEAQALKDACAHLKTLVGDGSDPYHPNLNFAVKRVAFAQREGPAAYRKALLALIADCLVAAGQADEVQQRRRGPSLDRDGLRAVA